ncbi:MAG: hypothetical protein K6A67_03545 [Bacteroidales bacterium]|nr:hypothetical protein [Bacteroidales bacterium]
MANANIDYLLCDYWINPKNLWKWYWVNNIQPDNTIEYEILQMMKKHSNVDPSAMECPKGWEQEALWR